MADQGVDEADQPDADAAALHHEAGQNEEGHGKENEVAGAVDHGLRQHHQRRRSGSPEVGCGGQQQDEADGDAGQDRDKEQAERRNDGGVIAKHRQPDVAGQRGGRNRRGKSRTDAQRHRAVIAPEIDRGVQHQQQHPDRQRQGDQGRRHLEDRRVLAPARAKKLDRNIAGDAGHEQHHDIGEREASPFAAGRKPAQDHPNEGMIAPSISHRAADERQDRQRQPCDLVGPQEGVREIDPRGDIRQHQHEFTQECGHDDAFGR